MALLKRFWADPVWSKVIATAVIALGIGGSTYLFDWWPSIREILERVWRYSFETVAVWNWIAALSILYMIGATSVLLYLLLPRSSEPFEHLRDYRMDNFDGVEWRWSYDMAGKVVKLHSCCPDCKYEITAEAPITWGAASLSVFVCEHCGRRAEVHVAQNALYDVVIRLIHRQLRSGEWLETARRQRANLAKLIESRN